MENTVKLALKQTFGLSTKKEPTQKEKDYYRNNTTPEYRNLIRRTLMNVVNRKENGEDIGTEFNSVLVESTTNCNLGCKQCYNKGRDGMFMDESVFDKINDFSRENSAVVFWTGGEPFSDDRIIRTASENQNYLYFSFTNGSLLNEDVAIKLSELHNLVPMIGIEGTTEETHDKARRIGSYNLVKKNVQILKSFNVPWTCATVLTSDNFEEVTSEDFVLFLEKNGAIGLKYHHFFPAGKNPNTGLLMMPEQIMKSEKRIKELKNNKNKYPFPITHVSYMNEKNKCKSLIYFDVSGDIKICPYFHYTMGNVKNMEQSDVKNIIVEHVGKWKEHVKESEHYCPFISDPSLIKSYVEHMGMTPIGEEQAIISDHSLIQSIKSNFNNYKKLGRYM